jgi:hypothetical protein
MDDVGPFPRGTRREKKGEQSRFPPSTLGGIIAHFILIPRAFWDDHPAIFKRKDRTPLVTISPPTSNIYRFSPDYILFIHRLADRMPLIGKSGSFLRKVFRDSPYTNLYEEELLNLE